MPERRASGYDDQQLVDYLLELLPDEDRDRLDEASIVDDELVSRLRVVEDDLVDSYVRGALTGELRDRFETRYMASPRRRERVRAARSFLGSVDRAAKGTTAAVECGCAPTGSLAVDLGEGPQARAVPIRTADRLKPFWQLAAVLALAASGALLYQTARLRSGLSVADSERVASSQRARDLEQQLADQRAANTAMAGELERLRESTRAAAPRAAERTSRAAIDPLIALVLLPQTRSIGAIPTLTLPPDAETVGVELALESSELSAYQAALTDPASGRTVWRSAWMPATTRDGIPILTIALPTRVLKPQHYAVAVSGRLGSGPAQVVGSYTFRAVPP